MKKQYIVILILSISTSGLIAQEIQFSQFFAAPLYLSPSFAGSTQGSRVAINFRDQWPKIPKTFISTAVSFDHNFKNMKSGLGVLITADKAGAGSLGIINSGIIYSYDINVTETFHIRPGMNFQYARAGVNMGELYSIRNIDNSGKQSGSTSEGSFPYTQYFDLTFSTIAYNKNYWGGFTLDHLFRPNEALLTVGQQSRIPIKVSIYGGAKLVMREDFHSKQEESLSAVFLYRKQSNNSQFDIGFNWIRTPIVLGIYYRGIPFGKDLKGSDALIFMAGYKIEDITIGYSYDFTISSLAGSTGGAHEISIVYTFNKVQHQKKKRWAPVPCPSF